MADETEISMFKKMLKENPLIEDWLRAVAELIVMINTIDAEDKS